MNSTIELMRVTAKTNVLKIAVLISNNLCLRMEYPTVPTNIRIDGLPIMLPKLYIPNFGSTI
jgi:hypothetical protein